MKCPKCGKEIDNLRVELHSDRTVRSSGEAVRATTTHFLLRREKTEWVDWYERGVYNPANLIDKVITFFCIYCDAILSESLEETDSIFKDEITPKMVLRFAELAFERR